MYIICVYTTYIYMYDVSMFIPENYYQFDI